MENEEQKPEVDEIPELQEETPEGEEDLTDWKAEALKLKGIAQRYKTRLDKVKVVPEVQKIEEKPEVKEQPKGLSATDIIALTQAKVAVEDIQEVESYAQYKGISIAEALKTSVIKNLLEENAENRRVAEATNVKTTRRSPQTKSDEQALADLEAGKFPDDPAELARLRGLQVREKAKKKN